jgi:predicted DNA-binding antitoxin AbrB/MazE fold protein
MPTYFEAVFEHGLFRPKERVNLPEGKLVWVWVPEALSPDEALLHGLRERARDPAIQQECRAIASDFSGTEGDGLETC